MGPIWDPVWVTKPPTTPTAPPGTDPRLQAGAKLTVGHREVRKGLHDEVVRQDARLELGEHLLHHLVDEALPDRDQHAAGRLLPVPDHLLQAGTASGTAASPKRGFCLTGTVLCAHPKRCREPQERFRAQT